MSTTAPTAHGLSVDDLRAQLAVVHEQMRQLQLDAMVLDRHALRSAVAQLQRIIAEVMSQADGSSRSTSSRPRRRRYRAAQEMPLTRREREVVVLICRGYTNQQIADELHVVQGTVASHVQHVLTKLNCTSRVQIATWAAARGLLDDATPLA